MFSCAWLTLILRNGAEAVAPPATKTGKFNHRLHTNSPHGTIFILALSHASIYNVPQITMVDSVPALPSLQVFVGLETTLSFGSLRHDCGRL